MNKSVLRKVFLEKRLFLSKEYRKMLDERLTAAFIEQVNLHAVSYLHVFLPILAKHEPNTFLLIDKVKQHFPDVQIVVSVSGNNGSLTHYIFEGEHQLQLNRWGIPEPTFGETVHPEQLDIVLVPLVCFDKQGHRIGYGKGYYDRFLAECKQVVRKIGYSYSVPLDILPYQESTDIPLDACVHALGYEDF